MSAISEECAVDVEVMGETDVELVEVGTVSETKGGILGAYPDLGIGNQRSP